MTALTLNESGVATCVLDGLTVKQTARACRLHPNTVAKIERRMRFWMGAKNRVELALKLDRIARAPEVAA